MYLSNFLHLITKSYIATIVKVQLLVVTDFSQYDKVNCNKIVNNEDSCDVSKMDPHSKGCNLTSSLPSNLFKPPIVSGLYTFTLCDRNQSSIADTLRRI